MGLLDDLWQDLLAVAAVVLSVGCAANVILRKRDERAAIFWVGVILLSPVVGSLFYLVFGINRISRRAQELRPDRHFLGTGGDGHLSGPDTVAAALSARAIHMAHLARLTDRLAEFPLVAGNRVEPLVNAGQAFPAMLEAIDAAERSVALSTYIFNDDAAGQPFVDALARAVARGVAVRVLIDGVGSYYSFPPIVGRLRSAGVPVARFLHSVWPWQMPYLNLRSHEKILVVDGRVGFTGGLNISRAYLDGDRRPGVRDTHFRLQGPVVSHLMAVFAENWSFTTHQTLDGDLWLPAQADHGPVVARGIAGGPDTEVERIRLTMMGAIAQARRSVKIVTPYFLPDAPTVASLTLAAMRGVEVDIVMPARNNLPYVKWASWVRFDQLAAAGCRLWLTDPPFDHSKLMVVDSAWTLVGSANWDERSLRLNFELVVECHSEELAARMEDIVAAKLEAAERITEQRIRDRGLAVRLRDGVVRLLSPYL